LNVVAVIPARGGSKGVPHKNIKKLGGKPLIAYTIEEAKKAKTLDRIIVSTDDDKIAVIAKKYGAEVPFKRPHHLSTDAAHTPPVIMHAVDYLEKKGCKVDVVVTLQPTSPFRKACHIDEAVRKLIKTGADAVMSVREAEFPPFWLRKIKKGKVFFFVKSKIDFSLLERQQLQKVYQPNGAVYATRRDFLMKRGKIVGVDGDDTRAIIMDSMHSFDTDTPMDFDVGEIMIKRGFLWKK